MAYRKRYAEALALHDAACSIYRTPGSTPDLALAEQNRAWSLLQSGRPADALAATSRSVDLHRAAGRAMTAWLVQLSAIPALCAVARVGVARTLAETSRATRPRLGAVEGAYETWMSAWLSHFEGDEQHCQAGRQVASQVFTADGNLASAHESRELPHSLPCSFVSH